MAKKITSKSVDMENKIVQVEVEREGLVSVINIWNRVKEGEEFYTVDKDNIKRNIKPFYNDGRKILTTEHEGKYDNHLPELPLKEDLF